MLKSARNRLSQSVASRPSSRDDSLEGNLDSCCDTDGDPFDGGFDQRPPSRTATTERRKLRRLHSASSAAAVDRIEPAATLPVTAAEQLPHQRQSLKQRAKNFLFRRRSFGSLESAGQHRVDGRQEVQIDPRLVRGYAAKRHHSDDCVLEAGATADSVSKEYGVRDKGKDRDKDLGGNSSGKKAKHKISRSLNFFASMRRGRSSSREPSANRASVGSSSEGGWTEGGGSTLGRRGHRNSSEQYMMAPQTQQPQQQQTQPQQPQQQYTQQAQAPATRELSSSDALASHLNEIAGLCLERAEHRGPLPAELFANWPAIPLEGASAWLDSTAWSRGNRSGSSNNKRHSMAVNGTSGPMYSTGSLTRGGGVAGLQLVAGGNLEAASLISSSTAEQLNVLCRQFNQAVTLRRSYRGKEGSPAATKLQRRSSGNWSGSSGSSSRTAESKSFTKQLSTSTTASKDSAVELKFEDDQKRPANQPQQQAAQQPQYQNQQQLRRPNQHVPQGGAPNQQQQQQQYQQQQLPQQLQHQSQRQNQQQIQQQSQHLMQHQQALFAEQARRFNQEQRHQFQQQQQVYQHQRQHQTGGYQHHHYYQPAPQYQHQYQQPQPQRYHHQQSNGASWPTQVGPPPSPTEAVASPLGDPNSADAPTPPRRSTSLRQTSQASSSVPASPATSVVTPPSWASSASSPPVSSSVGPVSPTYLNHLVLAGMTSLSPIMTSPPPSLASTPSPPAASAALPMPTMTSSSTGTPPVAGGSAAALRLGLITESPDDEPPTPPPRPTPPYRSQRSLPDDVTTSAAYRQWQGALPYPAVQPPPVAPSPLPPPPRPRQPLLPTPQAIAAGGDSGARIVRQARAKLSQLNRLSAELAKKQLRPSQPLPQCPFESLEQPSRAGLQSQPEAVPTAQHQPQPQPHSPGQGNWRASLFLQDEFAVREFLRDLTAVCSPSAY